MSRAMLPGFKDANKAPAHYAKQVCIYGFDLNQLRDYAAYGRKGNLERHKDIEILRFLELSHDIIMHKCSPCSLAVEVPEVIAKVEAALLANSNI